MKWVSGDHEMIVGRIIPPVGHATSTRMFTAAGRNLPLPASIDDFDGATTVEAAKAFIERAFGIGDLIGESDFTGTGRGRATIRQVTPYLFVTKEVIYSEFALLHGLERPDKARDIVASMPYFLRVTDEASAMDERRLRQLQRALDKEEAREQSRASAETMLKQRAISLLNEAHRIGIASAPSLLASEAALLAELETVAKTQLEASSYPNEGELSALHAHRREVLAQLADERRLLQATRVAIREAIGFEGAVTRQREKLMLAEHLYVGNIARVCPVCEAPSDRGRETAKALQNTLTKVRAESAAIERVKPRLVEHNRALEEETTAPQRRSASGGRSNPNLAAPDRRDETLADIAQLRAHLLGRISFFLEATVDEPRQGSRDLSVLRAEIAQLEAGLDRNAKEIKLRRAEAKVSQFASEAFSALPTVAPCIGSELDFSARQPEITVIEADSGAVLRMPDVGSDQNYLAIHIALAFALQRYFETVNAPVPGLLVFDQISRPYFPAREEEDETEIEGGEGDEDVQAMRKHIDYLFVETGRRAGLQVLLIEHAYFADDLRYVAATRERWTRASGRALIPADWSMRSDE